MDTNLSNILSYLDIIGKYILTGIISKLSRKDNEIWIISERGNEARDNGLYLFKYIKNYHPEISCYYVISSNSKDYFKLKSYKEYLINKGSIKHYLLLHKASKLISTHVYGATPDGSRFKKLKKTFNILKRKKIVFLQHGIIKAIIPMLFYENLKLDLFVSGAKIEYDFIKKYYHYPDGIVKYTGLPRYDGLNTFSTKRQILFMPTWRKYLNGDNFLKSEYYKKVLALLSSQKLKSILDTNSYKLVFFPHLGIQPFLNEFESKNKSNNIVVADLNYDVQMLLKESEILITDYSSVFFDFAYMKKPILCYQFDADTYYSNHYSKGEYDGELFGLVAYNEKDLLEELEKIIDNGSRMEEKYKANVDLVFPIRDQNNCKRVFEAIKQLGE